MKITHIDAMLFPRDRGCGSRPILCRIHTDAGLCGYGEAAVAIASGAPAAYEMIKELAPFIIGWNPHDNEVIWEMLFKRSFWGQGNGAIVMAAISALDIALWDIKAKAAGLPLYRLLGGKHRPRLRAYASQLQFGWGVDSFNPGKVPSGDPAFYRDAAEKARAEGYTAYKANFLRFDRQGLIIPAIALTGRLPRDLMRLAEERLAAVRDAVGPDADLIVENHAMTDAGSAVQFAAMARQYDIMFLEEPCTPLNPGVMRTIADRTDIPLATGERTYTRWGFLPFLENRSLSVIQPDVGNCGGITEAKKICDMAHIYDVGVQTHVCSSPLSVAIGLHLEAAIANFAIHEHHIANTLPSTVETCVHDYQPRDGAFDLPELPGLGQEPTEEAVRAARVETVR